MTPLDHYKAMARYNRWMNSKLYALALDLSDEERKRDMGAFFGSIHNTFNHLLLTDRAWLGRFSGDKERFASRDTAGKVISYKALSDVLYPDFRDLQREREKTDHDLSAFVDSLTVEKLDAPLGYQTSSGQPFEHPLWYALSHIFNHQTHHRGQATTLFRQLGKDPGVTDLVAMLRDGG